VAQEPLTVRIVLDDIPPSPEVLRAFLEGMVALNCAIILDEDLPSVYEVARYQREAPGREVWQHAASVAKSGRGDCEDLAAYRAAELRVRDGEAAVVDVVRTGARTLHAVVRRGDGSIEDVAKKLGMKGRG
jgi:hypothetical protein